MRYPCGVVCSVLVIMAAASGSISGQAPPQGKGAAAAAAYKTPRTPWGDPDLQGTWRTIALPLERPERFADRKDGLLTDAEIQDAIEKYERVNGLRLAGKGESRGFRANRLRFAASWAT